MNCYIPSGHLLRPAKATGVDKLRPLHKELGSGAERRDHDGDNDGPLPGVTTTSVPESSNCSKPTGAAAGRNVNSIRTRQRYQTFQLAQTSSILEGSGLNPVFSS